MKVEYEELKVLVEKPQKKWIVEKAKKEEVSQAEVVRVILQTYINKKN